MAYNYKPNWRIWTKIVALINLNVTVLHLLTLSWLLVGWICYSEIIRLIPYEIDIPENIVTALWSIATFEAAKIISGLWAANELIKATELGREPKEAYNSCSKGVIVNVFSLVITLLYFCWLFNFLGFLAYLCVFSVVEFILMSIVMMFMGELL